MIEQSVSPQTVQKAFCVILSKTNAQAIRLASNYLQECEAKPNFCGVLLRIYMNSESQQMQLQSLLLLTNVLKRNWQQKRNRIASGSFEKEKDSIRRAVMQAYPLHQMRHNKHMNQTLKVLARHDYPEDYLELHSLIVSCLQSFGEMLGNSGESVIGFSRMLQLLSTCKVVLKEYVQKRMNHNTKVFRQYIAGLIAISADLSSKLYKLLQFCAPQLTAIVLECCKKTDKITLYCMLSMPQATYPPELQQILATFIQRVASIDHLMSNPQLQELSLPLQGYMHGVLELVSKVQSAYPLLFAEILRDYLKFIIVLLFEKLPIPGLYSLEKLISTIILANLKIFITFPYYMPQKDFRDSIYNRKGGMEVEQRQQKCHSVFKEIYTDQATAQFLSRLLTQVMVSRTVLKSHQKQVDEFILQDIDVGNGQNLSDPTPYENCVLLCKHLLRCFKDQLQGLLPELFQSVLGMKQADSVCARQIIANEMELIFILPKIYGQEALPLDQLINLMSGLYECRLFTALARLIKNYQQFFNSSQTSSSFVVLARIVSTPINTNEDASNIYQCALAMKKMLNETSIQYLPLDMMPECLGNLMAIISLKEYMNTPTLLWPLINLSNQILKLIPKTLLTANVGVSITTALDLVVSLPNHEQVTVCALAEILENLLSATASGFKINYIASTSVQLHKVTLNVLQSCVKILGINLNHKHFETTDSVNQLWLCLAQHYPTVKQQQHLKQGQSELPLLNQKMLQLFHSSYNQLLSNDPIILAEIIEEYLICGLLQLTAQELLSLFSKVCNSVEESHLTHAKLCMFSLYFTYSLLNNICIPEVVLQIVQELLDIVKHISPAFNALRSLLLIIFHQHILRFSTGQILTLVNTKYSRWQEWFPGYIWSQQYVSNRLANKVNAVGVLRSVQQLGIDTYATMLTTRIDSHYVIESQYAIDSLFKTICLQLQPLKRPIAVNSYSNMHKLTSVVDNTSCSISRKIQLQTHQEVGHILEQDYRAIFRETFNLLMVKLDWDTDDLHERFSEATVATIVQLLSGQAEKQYTIDQDCQNAI